MWLLDANMPVQLVELLHDLSIEADSAKGKYAWPNCVQFVQEPRA